MSKFKSELLLVLAMIVFFTSCKEDSSVDGLLQNLHLTMLKQDSVMKVMHDRLNKKHEVWKAEYVNASGGSLDSVHLKLEQAHTELLEKHDDIIDKHEIILRMHRKLIEKYKNGKFDKDFIKEEHALLEEEYKLMQQDHEQLLADHAKLEKDHQVFMASIK